MLIIQVQLLQHQRNYVPVDCDSVRSCPLPRSAWDADCVIMQLEIGCITEHDQFDFNCFFYVVFIQFMIFKQQHVRAPDKSSKK